MISITERLSGMFGTNKIPGNNWEQPGTPEQVNDILADSKHLHLIYKHSFACGICAFTLNSVESAVSDFPPHVSLHFIDVRKQRDLSRLISEKTGIRHESPQVLLINNGEVVWHASHSAITKKSLLDAVAGISGK